MKQININFDSLKGLKPRFCVADIKEFLDNHKEKLGEIVVLYGLRRTGKTTIMQQIINEYKDKSEYQNKYLFLEIQSKDTMDDIYDRLEIERDKGTKLICIDEITNANDFINNSAILADIYAISGMQIIIAGTDSLSFYLARKELYDRELRIRTTHIPFAEHSQVLEIKDIDDYIEFGGLMKKGGDKSIIKNYNDAKRYLDEAVADNIVNSIKKDIYNDDFINCFNRKQLRAIIAKMIELYSGKLNKEVILEKLRNVNINKSIKNLYKDKYKEDKSIELLTKSKNRNYITENFINIIKANAEIDDISKFAIIELENYLTDLDILSVTNKINYYYDDENGWEVENNIDLSNITDKEELEKLKELERKNKYFYIIQPAIKYYHLQESLKFIKNDEIFKNLSSKIKIDLNTKLDEMIKGEMIEQIIAFDVAKILNKVEYFKYTKKYSILKPEFTIDKKSAGEYDLLVYDREYHNYYAFEIKHTQNLNEYQDKIFKNDLITNCINKEYGKKKLAAVLYRGENGFNQNQTPYYNITDFLIAVNKYKNINLAINTLNKYLEYNSHKIYKNIVCPYNSKIANYKKNLFNKKNEIETFNFYKEIIKENPFEFIYITDDNLPLEPKSLLKDGNKIYYESRLDYYIELVDIAINLQPILLEKVNFNSVIFSSLIKEQHYNFYMNLCEKAVNKLPLTIKNVKFEYFFNKEKNIDKRKEFIQLWETAINKDTNLIKYLNNSNIKNNDYLNLFFQAYKKDKNIEKYFDNEKLPNHYQNKDELFQKFNELINKNNTDYEFTKK